MTTTTETTEQKPKQKPDFFIFANGDKDKPGKPIGAAFAHKKGKGLGLLINGQRYVAFPPKPKTAEQPAAAQATTEAGA